MMFVRSLKRVQVAVAISTTLALAAGFLWPGVMGLFLVPVAVIYVVWAVRAALDHRVSIWLSFVSTLMVAVFSGSLGVSMAVSSFRPDGPSDGAIPHVAIEPSGNVVELPADALPRLQQMQAEIGRRDKIQASILLLIGLGGWLVLGMYAFEWRWAFSGKAAE